MFAYEFAQRLQALLGGRERLDLSNSQTCGGYRLGVRKVAGEWGETNVHHIHYNAVFHQNSAEPDECVLRRVRPGRVGRVV